MIFWNIFLLLGESDVLRRDRILLGKQRFSQRNGEHNIVTLDAGHFLQNPEGIIGELATGGFFGSEKLILLENLFSTPSEEADDTEEENTITDPLAVLQRKILAILPEIPPTNFVIFSAIEWEKNDLLDWLLKNARVETFHEYDTPGTITWIQKKAPNIGREAAAELALIRKNNLSRIEKDILLLTCWKPEEAIHKKDIVAYCPKDAELDQWSFLSALEDTDIHRSLAELMLQNRTKDPSAILAQALGSLRKKLWSLRLLQKNIPEETIMQLTGVKKRGQFVFLRKKVQSLAKLEYLFSALSDMDWKVKTGQLPGGNSGIIPAFQKILLTLFPHA